MKHISGENQMVDPLTKALASVRFERMRNMLGIKELKRQV